MHRKPKPRTLAETLRGIIRSMRRAHGRHHRDSFEQQCTAMEREIAARPWLYCNG